MNKAYIKVIITVCPSHLVSPGTSRGPARGSHCHIVPNQLCVVGGVERWASLTLGQPGTHGRLHSTPRRPSWLLLEIGKKLVASILGFGITLSVTQPLLWGLLAGPGQ